MRNATPAFKRALAADKRDYTLRAVITLADNTVLNLGNEDIWEDGMKIEDAVSADNLFEVGAAIVNQGTLVINNIYDDYSAYDFTDAHVVMYVGLTDLDDDTSDELRMGTFTVDEATYDGSIITLRCLDYMSKFDRAYTFEKPTDNEIIYPATLYNIVSNACHNCGVSLATNSLNFPHKDYVVTNMPSGESTTYRQVISWAAQIAVCFARCNANGELELKWYNTAAIEQVSSLDGGSFDSGTPTYETGDDADGGSFDPWNTGDVYDAGGLGGYSGVDYITSSYSSNVSTDNVVITGITVRKKVQTESSSSAYEEYTSGSSGYMVIVDGNEFIDGTHGQDVADWMGTALIGVSFRKADITHPNDPTIEAGDVGLFIDFRGNMYPIVISSTSFSCNNSQHTVSSAETPAKNSQQRFTESTRNYVELRKQQVRDFNALAQRIAESGGLYETDVTVSGATQRWYHDKPDLEDSNIVMVFTTAGFTLCDDYKEKTDQGLDPTWYGLTVDGQLIASILNADGVNADWINTGAITIVDGNGNETFYADTETGVVRINATSLSIASETIQEMIGNSWFADGVPTTSNYPAANWTTDDEREKHLNELYYDEQGSGVYRYTKKIKGVRVTFSNITFTNVPQTTPTVIIGFEYDGESYVIENAFDQSDTQKSFFIPSDHFWVYIVYQSAGSYNYSATTATEFFPTDAIHGPQPSYSGGTIKGMQLDTSYSSQFNVLSGNPYTRTSLTVSDVPLDGYVFDWQYIQMADQYARDELAGLDQEAIFNKLTNNGQTRGLYLINGTLFMSFDFAHGGTLLLGGVNNGNGVLQLYNSSGTLIGGIDNSGIYEENGNHRVIIAEASTDYYVKLNTSWMKVGSIGTYYDGMSNPIFSIESNNYDMLISAGSNNIVEINDLEVSNDLVVNGDLDVMGTGKHRTVDTENYGRRSLGAYETATPYFGDIGTGIIGDNGETVISLDDIFSETINLSIEYVVFLQKEGAGDVWIGEKDTTFFVVCGTPGLKFAWEIKAVQSGNNYSRLDDFDLKKYSKYIEEDIGLSMEDDLKELDNEDLFDEEI